MGAEGYWNRDPLCARAEGTPRARTGCRSPSSRPRFLAWGLLALHLSLPALAQSPRERVYTANQTAGTVTAFDTDKVQLGGDVVDFRVPDTITPVAPALSAPTEIALNPMLHYGYATEQTSSSLAVFDTLSNDNLVGGASFGGQIKVRIPLSIAQPFGVAVTPDGRLAFVSNAAAIAGIDGALPGVGGPTQNLVSVVDCDREVEIATIDVSAGGGLGPIDVVVSPDGSRCYVACIDSIAVPGTPCVIAIDVATLSPIVPGFPVFLPTIDTPLQIAITPANTFVYVACPIDNNGDGQGEVAFFNVATLTPGLVLGLGAGAVPIDVFTNRASTVFYVCDAGNVLVLVGSVAAQAIVTTVVTIGGGPTFASVTRGCIDATDEFAYVTDTVGAAAIQFSTSTNVTRQAFPSDADPVGIAVIALAELPAAGARNVQRVRESREDRNKGLCFIAGASYGDSEEVATLRAFRDLTLMPTKFGRSLVDLYYGSSPGIASVISSRDGVRTSVRGGLGPLAWLARQAIGPEGPLLAWVLVLAALLGAVAAARVLKARGRA
ncbi:MAG: YncE family protein [Planctomycetota bacterium]